MNPPPSFCNRCGAQLGPASRFCPKCGQPVAIPSTELYAQPLQAAPTPPTQLAPSFPEQVTPAPSLREKLRNPKIIIALAITVGLFFLACCLVLGSLYLFTTYKETTKTPKKTMTKTQTETVTPNSSLRSVDFHGVSFSYDPALASGVKTEIVPEYTGPDAPPWELSPEFPQFTFEGYFHTPNQRIYPQLSVYPAEEYTSISAEAGKQISSLKDFLDRKSTSLGFNQDVPFLPTWNSAQAIATNLSYLKFKNGEGVRFMTQYCQDVCPIQNSLFFYTFQGVTEDEQFVVSLRLPVSHYALDGEENRQVDQAFIDGYSDYILDMQGKLNAQPPSSFTPDLDLLDEIVLSLLIR